MNMNIFLTGCQLISKNVSEEEVNTILASYDNREKTRIEIKSDTEVFFLAKAHIIAIQITKTNPIPQPMSTTLN